MRERRVRRELDPTLEGIEVLVRAPEEDGGCGGDGEF